MRDVARPSRRLPTLLLLGLLACVLPTDAHAEEEESEEVTVEAALARLDTLTEVAGDQVGYAGTEGAFYAVSRTLVAQGDDALFRGLLAAENPVKRAMGLFGLVQLKGKGAVPDLRAALPDRTRFSCFPGGCMGWTISVGTFARNLLENRAYLQFHGETEPLLAPNEMLALDLGILADDRMVDTHGEAARSLRTARKEGRFPLDLNPLSKAAPQLDRALLVKAIGRLREFAFLRAVLAEETEAGEVRLAAASALTRDPEAADVLRAHEAFLDTQALGDVGRALVATSLAYRAHVERWRPIHAVRTWKGQEKIRKEIAEAVVTNEAYAIPDLDGLLGTWIASKPEIREAIEASLVRIAERCPQWTGAWDTWGDTPYRLEQMVVPAWAGEAESTPSAPGGSRALSPRTRARILEAIRPVLED